MIRLAIASDAEAIARVHVDGWRAGFASFLPTEYLESLTVESVVARWGSEVADPASRTHVAVVDDVVAGFLQLRADEIRALYVRPPHWNHGVGSMLLQVAAEEHRRSGFDSAFLWTARESAQARRFYERRGWAFTGDEMAQELAPGVLLDEVRYEKQLR